MYVVLTLSTISELVESFIAEVNANFPYKQPLSKTSTETSLKIVSNCKNHRIGDLRFSTQHTLTNNKGDSCVCRLCFGKLILACDGWQTLTSSPFDRHCRLITPIEERLIEGTSPHIPTVNSQTKYITFVGDYKNDIFVR